MIKVIFLKKEISKIFKSGPYSNHQAPQNCQQVAVVGTTVNLGRKHPKLDGILISAYGPKLDVKSC